MNKENSTLESIQTDITTIRAILEQSSKRNNTSQLIIIALLGLICGLILGSGFFA